LFNKVAALRFQGVCPLHLNVLEKQH